MSCDTVIKVKDLGKSYQIYQKPIHRLAQFVFPKINKITGRSKSKYFSDFWALKDVSFEVKRGESVGIIGKNGSGKSTLLQLLCGTLNPTVGTVEISGRVAALLELGSGFNPEFTGRENVYMNAMLLGLTKDQVDARVGEIERFADIGEFVDQPVKTYSSGMFVRLAFAVVANVDADILIIDEALSVGDAIFTQKCMRFIRDFQKRGTLLFVSHDTAAVQNLCSNAIWLSSGKTKMIGKSKPVSEGYLKATLQEIYGEEATLAEIVTCSKSNSIDHKIVNEEPPTDHNYQCNLELQSNLANSNGWKTGSAEIYEVKLLDASGSSQNLFKGGEKVRLIVKAKAYFDLDNPILGFLFRDRLGQDLFGENTLKFTDLNRTKIVSGEIVCAEFDFVLPMLPNGEYTIMTSIANGDQYNHVQHHWLHDAVVITVSSSNVRFGLVGLKFDKVTLGVCYE